MTAASIFAKDPAAVLDYGFDFAARTNGTPGESGDWLAAGETITAHTLTADSGITLGTHSESTGLVTAWVSGGTAGQSYRVYCEITTSAGRTEKRSIMIIVRER